MKNEELTFKVEGKDISIGSRKYPLRDINQTKVFHHSNTKEPSTKEAVLEKALNRVRFESGFCYSNADKVVELGREIGILIDFYSGWVIMDGETFHHAWNVFKGDIIDVSKSKSLIKLSKTLPNMMSRAELAKIFIEAQETKPRTSRDCVWGKVPEEVIYVGCPDDKESAVKTFNKLMEKFPHHSMRKRMMASGMTPLQQEIYNQKLISLNMYQ